MERIDNTLLKYILKRILYAALTVFVLATITFFMMYIMPGEPFTSSKKIPDNIKEQLYIKYGLDKPRLEQYIIFLGNAIKGDFGISFATKREVSKIIAETFPISAELGIRSLVFAIIGGILLGVLSAVKRGTPWDTLAMLAAIIGVSVPSFVMASLLQTFVALPLKGVQGIGNYIQVVGWKNEWAKFFPAIALGFGSLATISRLMRTTMLDVLSSDYIKTAKAKGISQRAIVWRHGVRNAILPVITVMGPLVAVLLTGGFVVEKIFYIPGMGKYFVDSVTTNDYTVIMGTTIFYGTFLVLANLVVDILYGVVDPRIRIGS